MQTLKTFFYQISPLQSATWEAIAPLFQPQTLKAGDYFAPPQKVAREVAFLESGWVRAFFNNAEGKEYNKQFFVGPSLIGAYTSLLTGLVNRIPQQALTDCQIWVANYAQLESHYAQFHDLERPARKIAEFYFL
ncbi:MAG: Crp/Fnr family transcriptional regulator, partial [Bacteroidota bacterium]